ncbi:MAG: molybdopterin-dependent oxidoreductase [Hahellaceae bacterium]|nr:molybdopterin-dependent oxidoreductase [Hahellaceae bacterium]
MSKPDSDAQTHPSACILCSRNCGISITTSVSGEFVRIKGDPEHPMTQGYICQKAARLNHYQHHAERLQTPLKRQSDGTFSPISWDQALTEIAKQLKSIRAQHGGDAFAFVGGGGQGNHLGGAYGQQLRHAMGSRFAYSALAQEKTQDFWVNGRLFGDQRCHTTEDVEHADYVLFIGCNPYQSHGIPNARDTLKHIKNDPARTMVVIDPRRTETAKMADIHLQVKPGTDAYLMTALLAILVQEGLHNVEFLKTHCTGFESLEPILRAVPVADYVARCDLDEAHVREVARGFAGAKRGCVRIDLGIQQTLHTRLNAYLEKLLYLVTGHFGKIGGNNLHAFLIPLISHSDERPSAKRKVKLTAHHRMFPISGLYPPNILPDEIEHPGEDRLRAVWVDSCNPVMTYADSTAYARAFGKLDLLVVVDVTLSETARLAHYVLPAASQFEKWEATGFNLEFPTNFFHLRRPILSPMGDSLPEPEIYTRLLEKMGEIPSHFPILENIARFEPNATAHNLYLAALIGRLKLKSDWVRYAPSILYRTLGPHLPEGAAAGAVLLPLCIDYVSKHEKAVRRVGFTGNRFTLAANLFNAILTRHSGTLISQHEMQDVWSFIRNKDGKIHLAIDTLIDEMGHLNDEPSPANEDAPFILMAGERRAYNANQIYRDPAWRKVDKEGALRMHPEDASQLSVADGENVRVTSKRGAITVSVEIDDSVRRGMVTLPHGYGGLYQNQQHGPAINRKTVH